MTKTAAEKLQWKIRKQRQQRQRRSSTLDVVCAAVITDYEDVIVEILARLPAKSLMRFRAVCTTWRSLISDPHFVSKHSQYDNKRDLNDDDIRVMFPTEPPTSIGLADLKARKGAEFLLDVPLRNHAFPFTLDWYWEVTFVGSCNGIVCVHFRDEFVLWNPCTGEHNVLPKPEGNVDLLSQQQYHGFGYDHVNDDYKVVIASTSVNKGKEPIVYVFSLRRGTWKTYPGPKNSYMKGMGGFLNGVLHWLRFDDSIKRCGKEVVPFSLSEERFLEVMLLPYDFNRIFVSGNHLCVNNDLTCRVMIMKEYGVQESWTQVLYVDFHNLRDIELHGVKWFMPVWILENADIVAWTVQGGSFFFLVYKLMDKTVGNVVKVGSSCSPEVTYRETLVSPVTGGLKDFR